ncbi:MAG: clostripain-related cysteine peptidase [bacterium]|nr:clostripain-related cysteine peptidase [bacterium]
MCADTTGEFYASWTYSYYPEQGDPVYRIYKQNRSNIGVSDPVIISSSPSYLQSDISCSWAGKYTIVWDYTDWENSIFRIYAYFSVDGIIRIVASSGSSIGSPHVVVSPIWEYTFVAWNTSTNTNGKLYDATAAVVKDVFDTGLPSTCAVAADPSNNFMVAGEDKARFYTPMGDTVVSIFTFGTGSHPDVASGISGSFAFVWHGPATGIISNFWRPWWTFMFYFCEEKYNVGPLREQFRYLERFGSGLINLTTQRDYNGDETYKYIVQKDPNPGDANPPLYVLNRNKWKLGEKDVGDPNVLQEFLEWSVNKFPASNYCLVMRDHGNGWSKRLASWKRKGGYIDWGGNKLTNKELNQALKNFSSATGERIDVIVHSACLLANLEMAYEIHDNVDVMAASEEKMYTYYHPYHNMIDALLKLDSPDTAFSSKTTGKVVLAKYRDTLNITPFTDVTFSVTDEAKIQTAADRLHALVNAMIWGADWDKVVQARANAQVMVNAKHFVDIWDFCDELIALNAYVNEATNCRTALSDAKIDEWHKAGVPDAKLLTIHFPDTNQTAELKLDLYRNSATLATDAVSGWATFLQVYHTLGTEPIRPRDLLWVTIPNGFHL